VVVLGDDPLVGAPLQCASRRDLDERERARARAVENKLSRRAGAVHLLGAAH
jgi:hypothetical protein